MNADGRMREIRCEECDRGGGTILVEIAGVYDGALFFECALCGFAFHRWPTGSPLRAKAEKYIERHNRRRAELLNCDHEGYGRERRFGGDVTCENCDRVIGQWKGSQMRLSMKEFLPDGREVGRGYSRNDEETHTVE